MKTVKVIKSYKDLQLGRRTKIGEILEVDEKRAEILLSIKPEIVEVITAYLNYDLTPPLKSVEEFNKLRSLTDRK